MIPPSIYAEPREVTNLDDCIFYHAINVPGYGEIEGIFDLREGVTEYLGGVDFRGKRVLEVGTANGFLCFHMEQLGAEVVAYDLSPHHMWDSVPFARYDYHQRVQECIDVTQKVNNAYWLCHRALNSRANVVHGTVYDIPETIGMVDISTFGAVLLHVRDPFRALEKGLRLTRETVIVTEATPHWMDHLRRIWKKPAAPLFFNRAGTLFWWSDMTFLPDYRRCELSETWWLLHPRVIRKFLGVLGFEETTLSFHFQKYKGQRVLCYTIVGRRTTWPQKPNQET